MSDPDHTKSLLHYRDILEAHEEEYRGSTTEGRPDIINLISEDIKKAAVKKGANITEGDTLHKQITNFYANHRSVPKGDEGPLTRAEEVEKAGKLLPPQRIALWSSTLSEIIKEMDDDEMARYTVLAEKWKAEGPPKEIQRREATEKTGKYVMTFLNQMKKNLGVHAVVFVAYQDEDEKIKISDFESEGLHDIHRFGTSHNKAVKEFRSGWGIWAKKTFIGGGSDDEEEHRVTPNPEIIPAEKRFLKLDDQELWKLGPVPDVGSALRKDLGDAIHAYVTQKWKLKSGGKRVKWKEIAKQNSWYIDESFLLKKRTLGNPTRLSEEDLRAYWAHWYNLESNGKPFTFKKVGSYNPGVEEEEMIKEPSAGDDEEEQPDDKEEQPDEAKVPRDCKSHEDKIQLLRSLLPQLEESYHRLINVLAVMEDGEDTDTDVGVVAGCFSWQWNSLHSDKNLHTPGSTKLKALSEWLNQDPHLTSANKLVDRAALLEICLGLGLLLKDAALIQFTEGEHHEETPSYIAQSSWETKEYNAFQEYLEKIWGDVEQTLVRQKKRKASIGDPAPAQRRVRKGKTAQKPMPAQGGEEDNMGESVSGTQAPKRPKPKRKTTAKPPPDPTDGSDESDKGEGPSSTKKIRKSSRKTKGPARYNDNNEGGGGKGSQKKTGGRK